MTGILGFEIFVNVNEPLPSSQGLYHTDQRLGPGVVSYPDGREDVGLWLGHRLLRLCTSVKEGFSLKNFPEYAAYMDPAATDSLTQVHADHCLTHRYARLKRLHFHTFFF